jgi:hypothetical protein
MKRFTNKQTLYFPLLRLNETRKLEERISGCLYRRFVFMRFLSFGAAGRGSTVLG